MTKSLDIEKIFPYHSCDNDLILTGYGYITAGFDIMLPEVFTTSKEKHVQNIDFLSNLIKNLPVGTIIHKQDYFYLSIYDVNLRDVEYNQVCKLNNLKSYAYKPLMRNFCKIFLSFPVKDVDKNIKASVFNLKDYIFSKPSKQYINKYNEVIQIISGFEGGLSSIGWFPKRMNNKSLASAIYQYWNISYNKEKNLFQDNKSMFINPYLFEDGDFKIGDDFVSVLSVVKQPETLLSSNVTNLNSADVYKNGVDFINNIPLDNSFCYPIGIGLPFDHIVNVVMEIQQNSLAEDELNKIRRSLNFGAGLGKFGGGKAEEKQHIIDDFIKAVDVGNYQLCKTSVNIIINHKDKKTLDIYNEFATQALTNMGDTGVWVENDKVMMEFMASAPGNTKTRERTFMSTTEMSLAYWIREAHYYSDNEGIQFLDRHGNPFFINMWENRYIEARNKVVFGPTGTGKSVLMNHYISEALGLGHHVVGIDVGGSYIRSVELNNGLYFDASDKEKLSFNPFLIEKNKEGKYLLGLNPSEFKIATDNSTDGYDFSYDVNFLYTVISATWKGEDEIMFPKETVAIIKEQIKRFYSYINETLEVPNFDLFYNYVLNDFKDTYGKKYQDEFFDYGSFELICKEFTSNGRYPLLLNAKENFDFIKDKYIVFDLEAISGDGAIKGLVAGLIINLVTVKIDKINGERVSFFIDEAIDFLKGEMGDFIGGMYRKIRKKEGEVIIATQSVEFLDSAVPLVMQSIKANTSTVILLDHSKIKGVAYPLLEKYFSFSKGELEQLSTIQIHHNKENGYGEVFIKMGDLSRVVRLQLSDYSLSVYDTRKKVVTEINDIRDSLGCSVDVAIDLYIKNKKE